MMFQWGPQILNGIDILKQEAQGPSGLSALSNEENNDSFTVLLHCQFKCLSLMWNYVIYDI